MDFTVVFSKSDTKNNDDLPHLICIYIDKKGKSMLIQLKEFHCDTDSLEKGGLMRVFFHDRDE